MLFGFVCILRTKHGEIASFRSALVLYLYSLCLLYNMFATFCDSCNERKTKIVLFVTSLLVCKSSERSMRYDS